MTFSNARSPQKLAKWLTIATATDAQRVDKECKKGTYENSNCREMMNTARERE